MKKRENVVLEYFGEKFSNTKLERFGTVFTTRKKKYFYDSGTGKVMECTDKEFAILSYLTNENTVQINWEWNDEELEESLETLVKECKEHNLLNMPEYTHFVTGNIRPAENKQISQIILELTQQCNLRCKYCIFNEHNKMFRNFELKNMEWEMAKDAIDYAFKHSSGELYVTFYGGEPLLNYKVLHQSIEYARSLGKSLQRKVVFNFTTNMTLVTNEMAEYFASVDNLSIMGSLDGPEEIHNLYRVGIGGQGSYDKTIRGLKCLVEAFGNSAGERISINGVLTPPYTRKKLDAIKEFFENLEWLPKNLPIRLDYVDWGTLKDEDIVIDEKWNEEDASENLDENSPLAVWCTQNMCDKSKTNTEYEFNIQKMNLLNIHKRYVGNECMPIIKRNGCCLPGSRRLYVTVEGKFQACERVGETPDIGDVKRGIDYDSIKQYYIDEYEKASIEKCNQCWACHLCGVCYVGCFSKDGIDCKKKEFTCMAQRLAIQNNLRAYFEIAENNPELLEELEQIEMV